MRITGRMMAPGLRVPGLLYRALLRDAVVGRVTLPGAARRSVYLPRDDGSALRLRVKRPPAADGELPGLLWLHGGGYCTGMPEALGLTMARLAAKRCVVVAPAYTLSCEKPYPAAFADCCAALVWMAEHAHALGIRSDQLFVGGESAGGGLAAAVCLWARDSGRVRVACQLPLYPMLDDRGESASLRGNDAPVWSERQNRQAWALYLRGLDAIPPTAAPARAESCAGLPPAISFVGGLEPFRDETLTYMARLRAAGVPVHFRLFPGCYHAFDMMAPLSKPAREARAFFTAALEHAIREYRA